MRPDLIGCDRCQVDIDSDRVLVGRPGRCCAADQKDRRRSHRSSPENRCGVDTASGSIAADRTRSTWPEPSQRTWRNLTSSTIVRGQHPSWSLPRPAQDPDPERWYRP